MSLESETAFGAATRIVAGDDGTTYDGVAIALHWTTALLVFVQFIFAEVWDYFAKPTQHTLQTLHISLGVVLTAVIIARLAWRFVPGHQVSSLEIGWVRLASKGVHYLLYILLVAQVALGFAFRWAQGHPVGFFGLFDIGNPLGPISKAARHTIHDLHEWLGWAIVIVAVLHALAALYHHYALKDRVLLRMLPSGVR